MQQIKEIKSCYIGPEISPEQFVPEHIFLFLAKGTVTGYDGHKSLTMSSGDCCIIRKNNLARYTKETDHTEFEKVVVVLDEEFLRNFMSKRGIKENISTEQRAFIPLAKDPLIPTFISSLIPYYNEAGNIDGAFSEIKREELLLILLKIHPELEPVLFDFGKPDKIDLKEFMLHNFRFNAGIDRFAYMTGRSLAAFKRDFKAIFDMSPGKWLVKRRLEEAFFLISKQGKRASDIYLDLGFEDLSHFSFAFKKQFGKNPTEVPR